MDNTNDRIAESTKRRQKEAKAKDKKREEQSNKEKRHWCEQYAKMPNLCAPGQSEKANWPRLGFSPLVALSSGSRPLFHLFRPLLDLLNK